ncbi:molybdopterin-dependent oxidoreductase [Halorussus salilacus]|uniref:molybdopterin-dependent oxidoreductase n=1 Tax=Halorussus salilacus TaxID=2953750 RepID=UPI0020A1696A|nr:molybdopterin-dependent oxidoreductase [Halorussus salilacus]USZ67678.1 molybdopterin-dependent oxidoreductase [Halorussus salilacus]
MELRTTLPVALASGVAAVAGSYAVAGFTPAFVAAPVADLVVAATPDAVLAWSIEALGDLGQRLGFALALALAVCLFGLAAELGGRLAAAGGAPTPPAAALGSFALAVGLTGAVVPGLAAGAATGVVAAAVAADFRGDTERSAVRRRVLRAVAASAAVSGVGAVLGGGRDPEGGASGGPAEGDDEVPPAVADLLDEAASRSLDVAGLEGLVSDGFYQVDINSVDPTVEADEWSLRVTGAVGEQREFDYADLTDRDAERRFVTLRCVGDSLNGKKMDTALWTGVPVTDLMGDLPEECCVMVRAADDYFQEFPLAALEDALLAYEMNGRPLPRGHGYPVRLLVPGHWGEINVKWVTGIEVLDEERKGYWEKRGWHGTGPVETVAKLHAVNRLDSGRVQVGGHAYAGTRGIKNVEVSTDGGESWDEATLSDPPPRATDRRDASNDRSWSGRDVWRQWEYTYEPGGPHEVVVRATDGEGTVQPREESEAFPSGPTGWVSRRVEA